MDELAIIRLFGRVITITNYRICNKNVSGCCIYVFSIKNSGFAEIYKHTNKK